jgi:hypothetical protein
VCGFQVVWVVEVCVVVCILLLGGWLVLVQGDCACHAVGDGLRSGATLVDVRLDVVPLPPRSSSQTVAGCWMGSVCSSMSSSCIQGQVRFGAGGSSLHSGIEFGRSSAGEGSSGGRKRGVV